MKAWVMHGLGCLRFEDVPMPVPGHGETLLKVRCAGICASDIPRFYSSGAYKYPIILGHEFSGETEDGRRVGVFPLLPCFECASCKCGHYETCLDYSYFGSRQDGAFAEYVAVPEWNLIDIPDDMSFEAAAMLEPAAVALHAAGRLDLRGVSSVAVFGNGVIGTLIARWLGIFGADMPGSLNIELMGRDDKPRFAGYDACVEAAGSVDAFRRCIDAVRPGGQIVLVGNPDAGFKLEQALYWQILRKQITVIGSWNSRYPSDWQRVIECAGELDFDNLIGCRYRFEDADKAFEAAHRKETRGRILVTQEQVYV